LKSFLKGTNFSSVEEIIEKTAELLLADAENDFRPFLEAGKLIRSDVKFPVEISLKGSNT
jgi:hypothetical protein